MDLPKQYIAIAYHVKGVNKENQVNTWALNPCIIGIDQNRLDVC